MPRQANQTSFKTGNRLAPKMVRGSDGKFATKAPTPRLVWTDPDALGAATLAALYGKDGHPLHSVDFPTKRHPAPANLFDAVKGPAETAQLTHGEIIALTAMSAIGIALIVSGLVWL